MSSQPISSDGNGALAGESVSRKPQQGRSVASLERMLSAARKLMLERGNEDFTLQDVSQAGNVSIGSIYLRFDGKDNLVRAVIGKALDDLGEDENAMIARLRQECASLEQFIPRFVEDYAEVLRAHASLMRLSMERAAFDPLVSLPGKARAMAAADAGAEAMLSYLDDTPGDDVELRAFSAFHVIFATLARQLSLGSTGESVHNYDWEVLKRELGRMCLAYLQA